MTPDIGNPKHVYFMGICGTAMGSVAAAFRDAGYRVTGSDSHVYDPMKTFLASREIEILDGYHADNVPADADFIVIGNAQSRGNPEVEAVLDQKLRYVSLPELLKDQFLWGRHNYIVSGTHGKTTTSSMLAWMMESGGLKPNFVIGGLPGNFEQGARLNGSKYVVIEGDEYDTAFFDKRSKFVHYLPEVAIVNNIEFDHADIFDNIDEVKKTFGKMMRLVPGNGLLLINGDDANCLELVGAEAHCPVKRVGFVPSCDAMIDGVEYGKDGTIFNIEEEEYEMNLHGEFNVRNAAMAVCAARKAGLEPEAIRKALLSFQGVRRRQEIRGVTNRNVTVVDDFAHHPTAIREAITGLRHKFNGARLWAVFEPRSNTTRRKIFQEELPAALGQADAICIAAIAHPEKFPASERLDTEKVMSDLRAKGKPAFYESGADAIVKRLQAESREGDVVLVFSNGGFDDIHGKLLEAL